MEQAAIPRRSQESTLDALRDSRVVLLHGPRQSGKTTIAREVQRKAGGRFVSLDEEEYLRSALRDPGGFVEGEDLLVIDEFQRGGDPLLLAIKGISTSRQCHYPLCPLFLRRPRPTPLTMAA